MKPALPPPGSRGIVLISTLAILAILTFMLVSFVSLMTQDRGATQGYTQSLKADQIAQGGLDQIVDSLRGEIVEPALSTPDGTGTNALYLPRTPSNAVPQHMVPMPGNLATIVKWSGTNAPWYTPSSGTGATNLASGFGANELLTTTASLNSRRVSVAHWNKPQLMVSTNGFTAPHWVLVTRNGPQVFNTFDPSLADPTLGNANYAVGRYAYVVYETDGLLDANVAGYPLAAQTNAAFKGALSWADLTLLTNGIKQTDIDSLVAWRNAASSSTNYYSSNVWSGSVSNGFTRIASGDTAFLGRQELIDYAKTQNPDLTAALPYLTTFSRELNGPTWTPPTLTAPSTNSPIAQVKVTTAGWTRQNGTAAQVGEPLVKYRFPLDKLALLEKQGTVGLADQDKTDILKYFGLVVSTADSNGLYRHWIYVSASGSPAATTSVATILTLDQVAKLKPAREPDFFELLKAGIYSGSVGQQIGPTIYGRYDAPPITAAAAALKAHPPGWVNPDTVSDYQIIRIGGNIIEQWKADSYPSTITFNALDFYPIEDLPYINKVYLKAYAPDALSSPADGNTMPHGISYYLYYELWNPHQLNPGANQVNYPTSFQILPTTNDAYQLGFNGTSPIIPTGNTNSVQKDNANWIYNPQSGNFKGGYTNYFSGLPNKGVIGFTPQISEYRDPTMIPGSTTQPWHPAPAVASVLIATIPFPQPIDPPTTTTPEPVAVVWSNTSSSFQLTQTIMLSLDLQFKDQKGTWRTYANFSGPDQTPSNGFITNLKAPMPTASTTKIDSYAICKGDPRTARYGAGVDSDFTGGTTPSAGQGLTATKTTLNTPIGGAAPFNVATLGISSTKPYRLDMWTVNDSAVPLPLPFSTNTPYYKDPDGVMRGGDSKYSYSATPSHSPLFLGDTTARPVMLHRPFRSVGELGYVFRDAPWKTLDFFSPDSADAALLDLFTLSGDVPVIAGRVSPNTPYPQVVAALVSGAAQYGTGSSGAADTASAAQAVGAALTAITSNSPIVNRTDLVLGTFMTNSSVANLSTLKTQRESAIRALAEPANTRTWNFLIDVVAQSGNYPATAGRPSLDRFVVTGERRYWLHLAIDRYTGQVVDRQLEAVNE